MLYKYPRTFHLPWSPGATSDDKILKDTSYFEGKRVIITEKMDGENTTISKDKIYARSVDSKDHESRHWVKANYTYLARTFQDGYRVCGENLFAQHSIPYKQLPSYFLAFSVWHNELCLAWDPTIVFLKQYFIQHVLVLYDGIWNETLVRDLYKEYTHTHKGEVEGYVVRVADSFSLNDFNISVAKYVRPNHVQTEDHWMYKPIINDTLYR